MSTEQKDHAPGATIPSHSDSSLAEKGNANEIEGGINHHSWDNHTSFNKYPTHEPGFENKVGGGCVLFNGSSIDISRSLLGSS